MKNFLILIILIALNSNLYSQNKTIKGKVINDGLETMPGVFIIINDTVVVAETNLNGYFQINIPISTKKVFLDGVGLERTILGLNDSCFELEIIIMLSGSHDFMSLKKADRQRMKRLRELPHLYKEAFEKGLFKTDKACYSQEIIPYYKNKK
jgi:hypothetical protein